VTIAKSPLSLFPQLRDLCWEASEDNDFLFISLLLGPSITSFKVSLRGSNITQWSLLSSIKTACPSIKNLRAIYNSKPSSIGWFSDHLRSWQTLDLVDVGSLSSAAILHLANMPTLRSLDFGAHNSVDINALSRAPRGRAFPVLQSLVIGSTNPSIIRSILSLGTQIPLAKISLATNAPFRPTAGWVECLRELPISISHHTLMSLVITELVLGLDFRNVQAIPSDVLKSLQVFSQVRVVRLSISRYFELDNALLKDMAMAWPHLKKLDVGTAHRFGGRSQVTLPGLIPLVEHCPDLSFIGIVLDAMDLTGLPEAKLGTRSARAKVGTINVGDSKVSGNLCEIAAFLSGFVSPDVNILHNFRHGPSVSRGYWDQVGEMIPYFVKVREQERLIWQNQA
jgi:hypothetical protein